MRAVNVASSRTHKLLGGHQFALCLRRSRHRAATAAVVSSGRPAPGAPGRRTVTACDRLTEWGEGQHNSRRRPTPPTPPHGTMLDKPLKKHRATYAEASSTEIWQSEDSHALAPRTPPPPPSRPVTRPAPGWGGEGEGPWRLDTVTSTSLNGTPPATGTCEARRREAKRRHALPQSGRRRSRPTVTVTAPAVQKSARETTRAH